MVKFEKISTYERVDFDLPSRSTKGSAGYDFVIPTDITIPSIYKNHFKLLKEFFSAPETLAKISEFEIVEDLAENSEFIEQATESEKADYLQSLLLFLPQFAEEMGELMTLDMETMKALTSKVGAKATLVPTGVKAKLKDNQKLELLVRSSTPLNSYLIMANSVGLIDSDYYNNEGNEGHIFFQILNLSPFDITLKKGEKIGQGIISTYETIDEEQVEAIREGGLGSTTK